MDMLLTRYNIVQYIGDLKENNLFQELKTGQTDGNAASANSSDTVSEKANHPNKLCDTSNNELQGVRDLKIEALTFDSREVMPNCLFVCKGRAFKRDYLLSAIEKGAICYVAEKDYGVPIPGIIVHDIRKTMPLVAKRFYNNPQEHLKIIGITGTKGKSTTTYYLRAILDAWQQTRGGKKAAVFSSIFTYDGIENFESHLTTPETMEFYRHLHNARQSGLEYVIMEVSSQGLKYNRIDGVILFAAAFLNISEDHISPLEHEDFDDYFHAKLNIFKYTDYCLVNADCDRQTEILEAAEAQGCRTEFFSLNNPQADFYGDSIRKNSLGFDFLIHTADFTDKFAIGMKGLFNIENALAAVGLALYAGCPREIIKEALFHARIPGRMEFFSTVNENILVLVDYAHNKLSFEKLFDTCRKEFPEYRRVLVFGCPGNKAITRRRDLGIAAGRGVHYTYLTEEDAAFEDVSEISREVGKFITESGGKFEIIEDRKEAISKAFWQAKNEKTILLVTGKGDETRQKRQALYVDVEADTSIVRNLIKQYNEEASI